MTKALQLARLLKRSGYKIILAEDKKYRASGHAWSNCVDSFYLLPSLSEGYFVYEKTLLRIIEENQKPIFLLMGNHDLVHKKDIKYEDKPVNIPRCLILEKQL